MRQKATANTIVRTDKLFYKVIQTNTTYLPTYDANCRSAMIVVMGEFVDHQRIRNLKGNNGWVGRAPSCSRVL